MNFYRGEQCDDGSTSESSSRDSLPSGSPRKGMTEDRQCCGKWMWLTSGFLTLLCVVFVTAFFTGLADGLHAGPSSNIQPPQQTPLSPTQTPPPTPLPSLPLFNWTGLHITGLQFYAIADVPYSDNIRNVLVGQVLRLQPDVDFLIHLGDIKFGDDNCTEESFGKLDSVLVDSPVPTFIVVGDNEYNECPNIGIDSAMELWLNKFERYDIRYRSHGMRVEQHPQRPEVFFIVHKRTLVFGLNLVGGKYDREEWAFRHEQQLLWVKTVMLDELNNFDSVIFFAHADPRSAHDDFFNPLKTFLLQDFFANRPLLYMCGDAHMWSYDPNYMSLQNMLRVRLTGGVNEPIVKVSVVDPTLGNTTLVNPQEIFLVERFLYT